MAITNNSFGVIFYLKKSRTDINGKSPIYARITVNGERSEISLKQSIDEKDWQPGKGMARGSRQDVLRLNNFLEQYRSGVVACYQQLIVDRKMITAELIKAMVTGSGQTEYTLCALMDYHNKELKDVLEWGTLKNYMTTQKYLKVFLKQRYKTSDVYLSEFSYKFITDFEHYLRNLKTRHGEFSLANNGIMKHLERLRKMVNLALRLEWIAKNPFASYQLKFKKVEREYLTREELKRIEDKVFQIPRLSQIRDIFIFSCYTGLAYIDVFNLRTENIKTSPGGEQWISTRRQKTDIPIKVPLLPKAKAIVKKYSDHPQVLHQGKVLPVMSNQKLNSYLKEIADLTKIVKPLTFHIARHTFATTITLSNGVPIETVSKMLGHTKLTTTQIYAKVIDRKIEEDMAMLKQKLS